MAKTVDAERKTTAEKAVAVVTIVFIMARIISKDAHCDANDQWHCDYGYQRSD
jgi:hypothetical protein